MFREYKVKLTFSDSMSLEDHDMKINEYHDMEINEDHDMKMNEYLEKRHNGVAPIWEVKEYKVLAENERDARRQVLEKVDKDCPSTRYIFLKAELYDFKGIDTLWDVEFKVDDVPFNQQIQGRNEEDILLNIIEKSTKKEGMFKCVEIISVKPSTQYTPAEPPELFLGESKYNILVNVKIDNEKEMTFSKNLYLSQVPTVEDIKWDLMVFIKRNVPTDWKIINVIDTKVQKLTHSISFDFDVDGIKVKKDYQINIKEDLKIAQFMAIRELAKENDPNMDYTKIECVSIKAAEQQAEEYEEA